MRPLVQPFVGRLAHALTEPVSGATAASGLNLDFTTGSLPTGVTATGGANATRFNSSGNIVAATAPRFDYGNAGDASDLPAAGNAPGLLVELASTNLALQSNNFNNAAWVKGQSSGQTVTFGTAGTGPDGVSGSAAQVTFSATTTTNQQCALVQLVTGLTPGLPMVLPVWIKGAVGGEVIPLCAQQGSSPFGVLGTSLRITATTGWKRYWVVFTPDSASAYLSIGSNTQSVVGQAPAAGGTVFLYNAQLEQGSVPTSDIITTTAAVTRTADVISFTVPAGQNTLTYTFADGTTQKVTVSPGAYTIPPGLRLKRIAGIVSSNEALLPLGIVAQGPHFSRSFIATNKWMMARKAVVFTEDVSSIQAVFANFQMTEAGGPLEIGSGATATIAASVEFPANVFAQLKVGGSASGTMAAVPAVGATTENGSLITDVLPIAIPAGATAWIRFYWTSTGGIFYDTSVDVAGGDRLDFGTTPGAGQDKTMGGVITGDPSHGTTSASPVCIIGRTNKPNGYVIGDSIAFGLRSDAPTAIDYFRAGSIIPGIPATKPFLNMASSSAQASNFASQAPGRMAIAAAIGGKYAISELGSNDTFVATHSAATLESDLQTLLTTLGASKVVLATLLPRTSGNATTLAGQTLLPQESVRTTFNGDVRGGTTGISNVVGVFECADAVEKTRNGGKWTDTPAPPYSSDCIHPNTAGNPLITTAVAAVEAAILV